MKRRMIHHTVRQAWRRTREELMRLKVLEEKERRRAREAEGVGGDSKKSCLCSHQCIALILMFQERLSESLGDVCVSRFALEVQVAELGE